MLRTSERAASPLGRRSLTLKDSLTLRSRSVSLWKKIVVATTGGTPTQYRSALALRLLSSGDAPLNSTGSATRCSPRKKMSDQDASRSAFKGVIVPIPCMSGMSFQTPHALKYRVSLCFLLSRVPFGSKVMVFD